MDSPLKSAADLHGKIIALPPRTSAVSRLMRAYLARNGLSPGASVTLNYYRSHVACMRQVLIHSADACGTAAPALRFFEHRMKVKLKTIAASRSIPHSLFAISPRVPKTERDAIRKRIISWGKSSQGKAILERGRLRPFRPISNSAYDIVRDMAKVK
jgi:ABC-type phosphate/phosphonate transport system substrate-binding protein